MNLSVEETIMLIGKLQIQIEALSIQNKELERRINELFQDIKALEKEKNESEKRQD